MLELLAIGQGLNAVKTAFDLLRMVTGSTGRTKGGEDAVKLTEHILSIQKALLAANEEQTALVQTINDLEKKVAGVDKWEKEKARYVLTQLPPGFSFTPSKRIAPKENAFMIYVKNATRMARNLSSIRAQGVMVFMSYLAPNVILF